MEEKGDILLMLNVDFNNIIHTELIILNNIMRNLA